MVNYVNTQNAIKKIEKCMPKIVFNYFININLCMWYKFLNFLYLHLYFPEDEGNGYQ